MHKYLCTGSLKPIGFPFQILSHSFGKTSKEKIKNQKLGFKANAQMHVCMNISISTSLIPKTFYVFEVWE